MRSPRRSPIRRPIRSPIERAIRSPIIKERHKEELEQRLAS